MKPAKSARGRWAWLWCGRCALAATIFLGLIVIVSIFWRADLVGRPFNFAWAIRGGAVSAMWFVPAPDGSVNGFGNPGPSVARNAATAFTWWPQYRAATSFRRLVVPIWPLALVTGAGWLVARRTYAQTLGHGTCAGCGYPLAGLPANAPCPECGKARGLLERTRRLLNLIGTRRGRHPQPLVSPSV